MSKYKKWFYPDKVNDLIDDNGNIAGLPVKWETAIIPPNGSEEGNDDEETFLVECTPEFYAMIEETVPSMIEAIVSMPGEEEKQKLIFMFMAKEKDGIFYAAVQSFIGDENIILAFNDNQAIVQVESKEGDKTEDRWGQQFTTLSNLSTSTYDIHRNDNLVNYIITLRNTDGEWIPGAGTAFPTLISVKDSHAYVPATFTDRSGKSFPVLFVAENGMLYFVPTDSTKTLLDGDVLYTSITFGDAK